MTSGGREARAAARRRRQRGEGHVHVLELLRVGRRRRVVHESRDARSRLNVAISIVGRSEGAGDGAGADRVGWGTAGIDATVGRATQCGVTSRRSRISPSRVALDQQPRPAELHARERDPLRPVDVDPGGVDAPHRDHRAIAIVQPEGLQARLAGDLNGRGLQRDLHGQVAAYLARYPPVDRQVRLSRLEGHAVEHRTPREAHGLELQRPRDVEAAARRHRRRQLDLRRRARRPDEITDRESGAGDVHARGRGHGVVDDGGRLLLEHGFAQRELQGRAG